jgi:putative peptidoglycan binding protein
MNRLITTAALAAMLGVPATAQVTTGQAMPDPNAGTVGTVTAPAVPAAEDPAVEIVFWDSIKDSDNPDLYLAYMQRYPNGVFRVIAEERLKEIYSGGASGTDTGGDLVPPPTTIAPPDDTQLVQHGVVVQPGVVQPGQQGAGGRFGKGFIGNPPIDRMGPNDHQWSRRQVLLGLQRQLRRVGCYYGAIDGVWGPASRAAVTRYNRATNNNFPPNSPNVNTWRHVYQTAKGRVCY